jgi:hypothetical protein
LTSLGIATLLHTNIEVYEMDPKITVKFISNFTVTFNAPKIDN